MFGKSILLGFLAFILSLSVILSKDIGRLFFDEAQAALEARNSVVRVAVYGSRQIRSLDTDLIKAFQDAYNLKIEYFFVSDYTLLKQFWKNGQFEIVVGRVPFLELDFQGSSSNDYDDLELGLFCNSKKISKIFATKPHLELIKHEFSAFESLSQSQIIEFEGDPKQLEKQKNLGPNNCIVAELGFSKSIEAIKERYHLALSFSQTYPLQFVFADNQAQLRNLVDVWIKRARTDSPIFRYWEQVEAAKYKLTLLEYRKFKNDIKEILPVWESTIKEAAREFNVPWLLVAAVAYQESKWNNDAISHTGVKGMMQLTLKTAEHIGVKDREDAEQSIRGGTNYLRYLYDKTPTHLLPFERWVFALASYNIGYAHMRDIRRIASEKKMNAYRWADLQKLLPLKTDKKLESEFYFGLARGNETVQFVRSVLAYHDYLKIHFHQDQSLKSIRQLQTSRDF